MARLFFIRHGEPEAAWGGDDRDPGLSIVGRAQAQRATETLRDLGPLAVWTSPMRRCRETAAPYEAATGTHARIEDRVSEVATPPQIPDRRAWLLQHFPWRGDTAAPNWRELDPELRAWRARLLAAVRATETDTAVFSHFIAINAVVAAAIGADATIVCRPDYASVTEMEVAAGALKLVRQGAEMSAGELR